GSRETEVIAVSSLAPPRGIDELIRALDDHRARVDVGQRRLRSRRLGALADFEHEHGERGLRRLGGRRVAEGLLEGQDPLLDTAALVAALERAAAGDGESAPPR
ncbi:MAG TPA: ArgK protein, partial [Solirubrobacteraceae bacterium]|nr:ArgK protein [Solirubrobacteraceae bacterium]